MKSPIKISWNSEFIPVLAIVISIALSFYFYSQFPAMVPSHWNFKGDIDAYSSKAFGAFFLPILLIGMYALFLFLPNLDPHKDRYQQFEKTYHNFKALIMVFLLFIYVMTGFAGMGYQIPMEYYVPYLVGVLFFLLGMQLKSVKMNWFLGIRTPWTMSSEKNWNETHQVGGILFMVAGAMMAMSGWLPESLRMVAFILTIAILLIGTMGYSYFIYWKDKK